MYLLRIDSLSGVDTLFCERIVSDGLHSMIWGIDSRDDIRSIDDSREIVFAVIIGAMFEYA